ncbi:sensor histidine kinase [Dermacoccus nishinomiyaensis]|uniref:sensor histidine kinase n=1 Tax=Dermacoccus nishinomiyaensis TaxID=1274 RepID=UPI0030B8C6BD
MKSVPRSALAEWRSRFLRPRPTDDLRADVEYGMALVYLSIRGGTVVLMIIGSVNGLRETSAPAPYAMVLLACAGVVGINGIAAIRHSRVVGGAAGAADVAVTMMALSAIPFLLDPRLLLGTWAAWQSGFADTTVAAAAVWIRDIRHVLTVSVAIAAVYVASMYAGGVRDDVSIAANALVYVVFGLSGALVATHLRLTADRAMQDRSLAVEAARRTELDRYRVMVHDVTGILRLLGDETTPPVVLPALRQQALNEAVRLRTYLSAPPPGSDDVGVYTLGAVVAGAASGFHDLPLELSVELGADARLSEGDALALQRALETVLHNVRRHALATQVVIHADQHGEEWDIVVRDDGVGFNLATTPLGFGLASQVVEGLTRRGMRVHLSSGPGRGTAVTVVGNESESGEPSRR